MKYLNLDKEEALMLWQDREIGQNLINAIQECDEYWEEYEHILESIIMNTKNRADMICILEPDYFERKHTRRTREDFIKNTNVTEEKLKEVEEQYKQKPAKWGSLKLIK